jgi:hypothetical protein
MSQYRINFNFYFTFQVKSISRKTITSMSGDSKFIISTRAYKDSIFHSAFDHLIFFCNKLLYTPTLYTFAASWISFRLSMLMTTTIKLRKKIKEKDFRLYKRRKHWALSLCFCVIVIIRLVNIIKRKNKHFIKK